MSTSNKTNLLTWRSHSYSTTSLLVKNTFLTKYICTHSIGHTWRATACPKLWAETYQEWASRSRRTGSCCQQIFPNPVRDTFLILLNMCSSGVPVTWLVMIQAIQRVQSDQNNYITILEVKRCSFVPHRSTIHKWPTDRLQTTDETASLKQPYM